MKQHPLLQTKLHIPPLRTELVSRPRLLEILNLQALAAQAGGDIARAMSTLEAALALAEPAGFTRTFVDEGRPMARLLYEAVTRNVAFDRVRRLLAAFPILEPASAGPPQSQTQDSGLIGPLSEREIKALQLIADGLTNREIASRLFLSLNTIKAHSRNIYGKLGVHSRTQATARSQELGLLRRE